MLKRLCLLGLTTFSLFSFGIAGLSKESHALGRSCNAQSKFSLAIHGGAVWGSVSHTKKEAFLKVQLEAGRKRLENGDKAVDVVEAVVAAMEDSGLFNAGKGSIANRAGDVEMDASIMDGKHLRAGSVASIRKLKNPVSAARLVMNDTPHVMMVGTRADQYLAELGAATVDQSYFLNSTANFSDITLPADLNIPKTDNNPTDTWSRYAGTWAGVIGGRLNHVVVLDNISSTGASAIVATGANEELGIPEPVTIRTKAKILNDFLVVKTDKLRLAYRLVETNQLETILSVSNGGRASGKLERRPDLLKKSGTVGAVAMDRCGDLAAATSTGGFHSKLPGRVGDSPIIGAGTYADNRSAAISATGHGEYFIRHAVAHEIAARIRHGGETLIQAVYRVVMKELKNSGGEGGVIAVDKEGNVVMLYNTDGMVRGRTTETFAPKVETYFSD